MYIFQDIQFPTDVSVDILNDLCTIWLLVVLRPDNNFVGKVTSEELDDFFQKGNDSATYANGILHS